ncbi:hypothetical protein LguiA_028068 [Lonicera macranthoides]
MNLYKSKTACLFCFLISLYIFLSCTDKITGLSILAILFGALAIGILVIVAVRTTIVTWITVLVILAFAGKRRRVLVVEGRKISAEVAMYLVKVLVKERGRLVAFVCATIVSSMAMASLAFVKGNAG